MKTKLEAIIKDVVSQLGTGQPKEVITRNLTFINHLLTAEATRLGVALPANGLPDPSVEAENLVLLVETAGKHLLSSDGDRDLNKMAGDLSSDPIEGIAQNDI